LSNATAFSVAWQPRSFQNWFGGSYDIPYGISKEMAQRLDKLGATYMAHEPGTCRNMVTCMNYGQAAETAAAIAVKHGISPRRVDVSTLRKTLESQDVVLRKEAIDMSEVRRMVEVRGIKIGHVA
jgi:hypothetical protein